MLFMLADGVLERWGGIIDKRLGDGILAVFRGEGAAARALGASGELHQKVLELDEPARAMGAREIRLRSGLTCGPVVAGTIGTQVRYEYTVIGRVVNLAQRLQAHGNEGETVLSLPAWKEAGEPIEATPEEHWMFRGFPEPIGFRRIVHRQASSIESTFAHAQETP
jgi:class 3 adenylate cyclase